MADQNPSNWKPPKIEISPDKVKSLLGDFGVEVTGDGAVKLANYIKDQGIKNLENLNRADWVKIIKTSRLLKYGSRYIKAGGGALSTGADIYYSIKAGEGIGQAIVSSTAGGIAGGLAGWAIGGTAVVGGLTFVVGAGIVVGTAALTSTLVNKGIDWAYKARKSTDRKTKVNEASSINTQQNSYTLTGQVEKNVMINEKGKIVDLPDGILNSDSKGQSKKANNNISYSDSSTNKKTTRQEFPETKKPPQKYDA